MEKSEGKECHANADTKKRTMKGYCSPGTGYIPGAAAALVSVI